MKKVIAIILTLSMVLTMAFAVYASNGKGKGGNDGAIAKVSPSPSATVSPSPTPKQSLKLLLEKLKTLGLNDPSRSKLMKQIIDYRKKTGVKTMPVFFNNALVTLDSPTVVKGFTVYLPAKSALSATGATIVESDKQLKATYAAPATTTPAGATYTTTATTTPAGATIIIIDKKNGKIFKNGSETKSKVSAKKINNKWYIPSEFFSKVLDMKVDYDKANGALLIYSKGFVPAPTTAPSAAPTVAPSPTPAT